MYNGVILQVWPANNGWNQQHWSSPGMSTMPLAEQYPCYFRIIPVCAVLVPHFGLGVWSVCIDFPFQEADKSNDFCAGNPTPGINQEEDWAAKARAWAAAKAAQEAQQQAQQQFQTQSNLVSEQPFPDTPQQPPPLPPPHQLDLSQQFAYQPETGTSGYGLDGPSIYSQDVSQKYGRDAPGHFQQDSNSRILEEERNFPQDVSTSGSGLATVLAPLPPRNIVQLVPCSYPQDVPSNHVQDGPAAGTSLSDICQPLFTLLLSSFDFAFVVKPLSSEVKETSPSSVSYWICDILSLPYHIIYKKGFL